MIIKSCSFCDKGYEKANFYRHLNSSKHQLKTGTETKCDNCKKLFNTEEKSHNCQHKFDN